MSIQTINAADAQTKLKQGAVLVDIRAADEYRREHIENTLLQPLPQLQAEGLPDAAQQAPCVIFYCKSGIRTQNAAAALEQAAGGREVFILEKGLDGWKSAGLPTLVDRS
ncbi:rhodanese-like domain-containing protein, partial [Neisseria dentiae]|uniref:rhodanese-like domain-containing protein n=1 Tax=Neisseria dentiae TaxID=194197 RepID=UPI00359F6A89